MPVERDDPVNGVATQAEWLEIVRAVSASAPGQEADLWVGQLVVEVQKASDRAVAAARHEADSIVADARADAIRIRAAGRRRARTVGQMRALMRQASVDGLSDRVTSDVMATRSPTGLSSSIIESTAPTPPPVHTAAPVVPAREEPPDPFGTRRPQVGFGVRPAAVAAALVIVLAALGVPAFERYGTAARERTAQHRLVAQWTGRAASRSTNRVPTIGEPVGVLDVPRLAVKGQIVVEGATLANLRRGPAHETASQLPGRPGAVILLGRRTTYGGPFRQLDQMQPGDTVSLRLPGASYLYRIGTRPQVLKPGSSLQLPPLTEAQGNSGTDRNDQVLVLATSVGARSHSLLAVVATLDRTTIVGGVARTSSAPAPVVARLRSVPGDGVGEVMLLGWCVALIGTVMLARRLRTRVPAAVLYGVGSFVVVIALSQMYQAIDRLLPGTY